MVQCGLGDSMPMYLAPFIYFFLKHVWECVIITFLFNPCSNDHHVIFFLFVLTVALFNSLDRFCKCMCNVYLFVWPIIMFILSLSIYCHDLII